MTWHPPLGRAGTRADAEVRRPHRTPHQTSFDRPPWSRPNWHLGVSPVTRSAPVGRCWRGRRPRPPADVDAAECPDLRDLHRSNVPDGRQGDSRRSTRHTSEARRHPRPILAIHHLTSIASHNTVDVAGITALTGRLSTLSDTSMPIGADLAAEGSGVGRHRARTARSRVLEGLRHKWRVAERSRLVAADSSCWEGCDRKLPIFAYSDGSLLSPRCAWGSSIARSTAARR